MADRLAAAESRYSAFTRDSILSDPRLSQVGPAKSFDRILLNTNERELGNLARNENYSSRHFSFHKH